MLDDKEFFKFLFISKMYLGNGPMENIFNFALTQKRQEIAKAQRDSVEVHSGNEREQD